MEAGTVMFNDRCLLIWFESNKNYLLFDLTNPTMCLQFRDPIFKNQNWPETEKKDYRFIE